MRLLMTTDTVGGVWTYSTELVQGLLQQGAAVALVTLGAPPSREQAQWLRNTAARWPAAFVWRTTETPLEWMSDNEQAYSNAAPLLLRMATEFGAELLHSNQFCFGALPVSIPKLIVAHSDVLSWSLSCNHALEPTPWLQTYCALASRGLLHADAVVAPTRWMLDELTAIFDIPGPRYVVANGRTLSPRGAGPERRLQAVSAGRLWDEAKNLRMLAQVSLPFPLMVAGEKEFQSSVAPALPAGAVALGSLTEEELHALFQESAIYICTSRYEPFGLAPLEAALCGCAVLANDIPSLREVWGGDALYFNGPAGLSRLLDQLARHPDQLQAAQRRSWSRAQKYTGRRMTEQYLAMYQTMLAGIEAPADVA